MLSIVLEVLSHDGSRGLLLLELRIILDSVITRQLEVIPFKKLLVPLVVVSVALSELIVVILLSFIQHVIDEVHRSRFISRVSSRICEIIYQVLLRKFLSSFGQVRMSCWSLRIFCREIQLASVG